MLKYTLPDSIFLVLKGSYIFSPRRIDDKYSMIRLLA